MQGISILVISVQIWVSFGRTPEFEFQAPLRSRFELLALHLAHLLHLFGMVSHL